MPKGIAFLTMIFFALAFALTGCGESANMPTAVPTTTVTDNGALTGQISQNHAHSSGAITSSVTSTSTISPSPYVSQLNSPVRGLSSQEVDDLLNGRGAAYARTAELNSNPGPSHILDMKVEVGLSAEQIKQIETVRQQMQTDARQVGAEIVRREKQLSADFAARKLDDQSLATQTAELGQLYAQYRAIHLKAHLQITPLLTVEQIARYNVLRGY
jgi:Spy/CpxP family protein refolding chaperone